MLLCCYNKEIIGPRTPTPFKNAMAALGRKHRLRYVPPSPSGLVEDLAEIIHDEQCNDFNKRKQKLETLHENYNQTENVRNTSNLTNGFGVDTQFSSKNNACKLQVQSWSDNVKLPIDNNNCSLRYEKKTLPFETETPSKLLNTSDASDFSKHTLCEDDLLLTIDGSHGRYDNKCNEMNTALFNLDPKWEILACGQTNDQQYMLRQAHACLKKFSLTPRTLNFEKPITEALN